MGYRKCPRCELNYITDDEEYCDVCKEELGKSHKIILDNNKAMVERDLLPILRSLDDEDLELFLRKDISEKVLGLHLPLLIKCENKGIEHCRKEVRVDNGSVLRYYVNPYNINGKFYHICSQWWSTATDNSKDMLKKLRKKI